MSVTLSVRFLAGRYHATPWDRQVNEGVVEWPPSPWRLLRALVAAWHKSAEPPPRETLAALVEKLGRALPSYELPPTTEAHTRHYMPLEGIGKTTKVLDAFVAVGAGARDPDARLRVSWPEVELAPAERDALDRLCGATTYLGRAESWAEVALEEAVVRAPHVVPAQDGATGELLRLLAPDPSALAEVASPAPEAKPKKKRGKKKALFAPTTILEALEVDTGTLQAQAWSEAPATRWADFRLLSRPAPPVSRQVVVTRPPTVARYALASQLLPSLTDALSVGERFRKALMSWSDAEEIFAGKDAQGRPLAGHGHARYLPEDADGDGRIDHVVVHARRGFSAEAVRALQSLHRVWGREGFDLRVSLDALGQPQDYGAGRALGDWGLSPTLGRSRVWRSLTPVVLPRHPKTDRHGRPRIDPATGLQKDGPEDQIRRLLEQLGLPPPREVELVPDGKRLGRHPWHAFGRIRQDGGGRQASARAYGFILRFDEPVTGPIALGYASHMGLGVFVPAGEDPP